MFLSESRRFLHIYVKLNMFNFNVSNVQYNIQSNTNALVILDSKLYKYFQVLTTI
jgi:hypothetical protein